MAYESIKVDIIPGAENAEVLHFSQYDNKRPFFIELFNGGAEFIPESGMTLTLECKKRDGNIVILSDPVLTDNVAEFSTTEQLTACYGDNTAEIKIVDDNDLVIGSANFIINVEKSPICGGLVSESEIDNLTQQIAAIVPEVIGDDYYNKIQTDALLANKANMSDLAPLASKAELTQAILDEDTALKNWVSSNFATPGYVNDRIFNLLPVGSASGNPCIFYTEIEAPLQALTADIVCGGGGGTPLAPIPLVGHSELNLTRCGVNIWDGTGEDGKGMATNGGTYPSPDLFVTDYIVVKPNTRYYANGLNWFSWVNFYSNPSIEGFIVQGGINNGIVEVPENCYYARFTGILANKATACINYPSSDTDYHTYNGQTFTVAFGQTVYGGVYDKSGRLTIDTVKVVLDGTQPIGLANWNPNTNTRAWIYLLTTFPDLKDYEITDLNISSCKLKSDKLQTVTYQGTNGIYSNDIPSISIVGGDYWSIAVRVNDTSLETDTAINNYLSQNPIEVCYELATPIVIDVPSISVFAENGTNNITSDCIGDVNVSYKDTIQHYIDSRI